MGIVNFLARGFHSANTAISRYPWPQYRRSVAHIKTAIKVLKKEFNKAKSTKNENLVKALRQRLDYLIEVKREIVNMNSAIIIDERLERRERRSSSPDKFSTTHAHDMHDARIYHLRSNEIREIEQLAEKLKEWIGKISNWSQITDEEHHRTQILVNSLRNELDSSEREAQRLKQKLKEL